MNETLKSIYGRRSVRRFLPNDIDQKLLEEIIRAGMHAPSSYNTQSWYFTVIKNKRLMKEINQKAKFAARFSDDSNLINMSYQEKFDIFYGAPVIVIVSERVGGLTPVIDTVSATQNILIAAESLGLASCWNGIVKWLFESDEKDHIIKRLAIPKGYKPSHAIALGYSDQSPNAKAVRDFSLVNYIE